MRVPIYLLFVLCASLILSLGFGAVPIPVETILHELIYGSMSAPGTDGVVLWNIRLPRTLFAICTGAGLALVGLAMQTITRNALADPYILGVSSGAGAGAACAIVLGIFSMMGAYAVSFGAFLGALIATSLVILLVGRSSSPMRLVLIGMGISALFSAATLLVIYSAKHEAQVRSAMFYLMGSLSGIQWGDLPIAGALTLLLFLFLWFLRHDLDLLLLGEDEAKQMGLSVKHMQLLVVLASSLTIAVLVAKGGVIGFVGLVIPHIARIFVGPKHGTLTAASALLGALAMLWADVFSRTLFRPEELPIGVLTAGLGAPIFLWIICKRYGDR